MKLFAKSVSAIMALAIGLSGIAMSVRAEDTDEVYVNTGTYSFSPYSGDSQIRDTYTFREDCFMRSSYLGCYHLAELSLETAKAGVGRYYTEYESDYDRNSDNIRNMLDSMGFADIETNKYYSQYMLPNSVGVAIGRKTVEAYGKTYTLLAIVPRGAGYKQEWAGDMITGGGSIHEGFMRARDEVLRFAKKYINDNGIEGDLKIWTMGHSRGAGVANLLGGFFAAGGISYFGDSVSLSPEDLYCYTFGTPRTIKDGVSKKAFLSVSAPRGGRYSDDTEGAAYTYSGSGNLDLSSKQFSGIRNYNLSYDLITMMPPAAWGFEFFGKTLYLDGLGVSADGMATELGKLNPAALESFNNGDFRNYHNKTFDIGSLSIVNDSEKGSFKTMLKARLKGLIYNATPNSKYASGGYQDVMSSGMGLESMLRKVNNYSKLLDDTSSLISPLLATYLAYACERVQEEGKADTEKDALTIVLADFISYATDKEIDTNNYTAEDFFIDFLTFVFKEGNEEMADKLVSKIGELIPEGTARDMVASAFVNYVPDYKTGDPTPEFNVILSSVFKACVYGADPNSLAWDQADGIYRDPANVRGSVCFMLALGLTFTDAQYINLGQIISRPSAHSFGELVNELYPLIIDDNSTIAGYAESGLKDLLDYIFLDAIEKTKDIYGQEYYDDCVGHLDTIKANISQARQLLSYTLFYSEGKSFNTGDCIKSAASFLGNVSIVAPAHDSEIYLAWIRAINKENPDDHYIEHVLANKPTCTVDGNIEHWALHEKDEVTYYDDSKLTTLLAEEEIIDPKTGHTPGADVTILPGEESTCSENGYHFEVRYCEVCGEEASRTQVEDPLKQHTWGDWIEMTPATLDSEGEEVRTCSVCGKTETRKVPVLTPTPTATPTATPTPTTSPEPTGVEPTTAPKPTGVEPTTNPEPTGAAPTATPTKAPVVDPTAKPTAKPTSKPTPAHVKLTLNKTSATIVCGKNLTLKAKQSGSNDKIAWGTSNNKIAKVDSSGKVTAKMAGSVTVTAYAAGQKATCTVQVLYKDVTNSKDFWYKPTYYLTDKGVVKGYDKQTNFKPANNCTRAQMVAFIWRLMGEPAPKAKTCKFKDVKKTDYFYKACIWGNENHIVEGYKDGTFGPQIVCARRHAVTFLWRLAGKPVPKDAKNKFSDVKKSDYFYTATLWASETGILAGYSDGTFKPNGDCLRRQMVTFLYKYDKYINKKG